MTDYIAVSRGGDLPGMAGHEVSMPIHNKEQLRLWRNFNKCSEIFHSAFTLHTQHKLGVGKDPLVAMACKELTSAALDANFATAEELAESYGDEWTKWHTRTSWVVKRNGR
tara:strand:- start:644 stop:976 length:333 start_codon:yes stop_codon:yes gene_type:complete